MTGTGLVSFVVIYGLFWITSHSFAPIFGRVALPCSAEPDSALAMQSTLYCILNRHYVAPELADVAGALATSMDRQFPGTRTLALDASFPFFDGFPLLPHLSHDDGNKLDLAFYYRESDGTYRSGLTRSPIGYWAFEEPRPGDPMPCAGKDGGMSMRWDMGWFQRFNNQLQLDEQRTAAALRWLARDGIAMGVSKIFVEPHLVARLNIGGRAIRFQGCFAARHDDHIHFQIR